MSRFGFGKKATADTDDQAWASVNADSTVRTTPVAVNYKAVSEGELTGLEKRLDARKRASKRFARWLGLLKQWESVDAGDTVTLAEYQTDVAQSLVTKQGAIAAKKVELEKLRLPQARMAKKIADTRVSVDAAIESLHKTTDQVGAARGWDK